jgi:C1A family cysteine protease
MRTKTFPLFSIVTLLLLPVMNLAHAAEIDDIQSAIAAKHAKWTAKTTPLHLMAPQLRKMRAALVLPSAAPAAIPAAQTSLSQPLSAPTAGLDWRNFGGTNYVTPPKDQKDCGSCWAFSTTGALESYTLIHGSYSSALDLSEQIMISCSGAGSCSGGVLDRAATFVQHTGLPVDSMDPYVDANGTCTLAAANWQASTDKIAAWEWIVSAAVPNITSVKNALYTYGPLVASMRVYSDFYSYGGGVYSYTTGPFEGNHAILIVGYADDSTVPGGGYFIVKNSWGQSWGEGFNNQPGGYFRIAYSEAAGSTQFAQNVLAYDAAVQTCSYSISATGTTLESSSANGSVGVITSGSCTWSARSSASWLTVSGSAGKGNGSIGYAVAANTGTAPRTGTVTVIDAGSNVVDTYTVTQKAPGSTYTLTGVVRVNSSTGAVLPGATVTLGSQSVTTDSTGSFLFSGIAAGKYTLTVSKSGYTSYANTALSVASNQSVAVVLPQLPQLYSLSGTVTSGSASGPALAGAVVSMNGVAQATTGSAGSFSIVGIPGGSYAVTIAKPGFASFSSTLTISANLTIKAALVPATYKVSGTVRSGSSTGPVISGATVSIAGRSVSTNSAGVYSVDGIAPGTSSVSVTMAGYAPYTGSLGVSADQTLNIALTPSTYSVSGTVRSGSSTGAMVTGATVTIGTKSAVTNSAGAYSITGLVPGVYPVSVTKTGYLSYTNGTLNVNANLVLGTTLVPVTYTLSGTIRSGSSTGALVAGATVSVSGKTATSNSAGVFSVDGIQAGTYAVSVTKTGYTTFANPAYLVSGSQVLNANLVPVPVTSTKK